MGMFDNFNNFNNLSPNGFNNRSNFTIGGAIKKVIVFIVIAGFIGTCALMLVLGSCVRVMSDRSVVFNTNSVNETAIEQNVNEDYDFGNENIRNGAPENTNASQQAQEQNNSQSSYVDVVGSFVGMVDEARDYYAQQEENEKQQAEQETANMGVFCSKCGTQSHKGDSFCAACGTQLESNN